MFSHFRFPQGKLTLLAVWLACSSTPAHALTFDEALRQAQTQAPQIRANREGIAAAKSAGMAAGELPDPKIILGIDNLPIEGTDRFSLTSDPMTMQRIGFMQEFPNRAKRDANIAAARSRVALAESEYRITQLVVQRETAAAWIARYTNELQLKSIDALLEENRLLDAAVRAQFAGGRGMAVEIVMPRQEAAMIEERRDELRTRREQAVAALRRWIGSAAEAPLEGTPPDWPIGREALMSNLHRHPELIAFAPRSRVLDAEINEAQADKKPDWALELAYQKRGSEFDDMVTMQVSFDLPLFTASRQEPIIAARQADRSALEAEREATLLEHAAMLEADLAEHQRLARAVARQREVLLPLAVEKVRLALAAWRGGKGSLTDLVAARRERVDAELRAIALDSERLQLAARLFYTYSDDAHAGEHR